jgi:hypothetical protein
MRLDRVALAVVMFGCKPDDPIDADGDGHTADVDCNDADVAVHPGADEIWYDGVAQGCDDDLDPPLEFVRVPESLEAIDPGGPRFARDGADVELTHVFENGGALNKSVRTATTFDAESGDMRGTNVLLLDPDAGADFTLGRAFDSALRGETSVLAVTMLTEGAPGPRAALLRIESDGTWVWNGLSTSSEPEQFEHVALHDVGDVVSIVGCGSSTGMQWISGTFTEFDETSYTHIFDEEGASRCEVVATEIRALDDGEVTALTVEDDAFVAGDTWEDVIDLDWDDDAFLLARDDGLTVELDGDEIIIPTSVPPESARFDVTDAGELFIAYATEEGDLYLIYGMPDAPVHSLLGEGLAKADLDLEATDETLFVAARSGNDAWVTSVERRDR